ncbi:hypothetical protein GCM10023149_04690 [Mucilaginibacter gynuensis]|uniref:CBU-0592-like domain-containing protein n=1 Tax=Mucilaginibacter gynuensis TaxID=1302236 RepID=A0ABP8FSM5_9SPHI
MHHLFGKTFFDGIGWFGALFYLVSYFLLIIKKWRSTSFAFHLCNILGGLLLSGSALYDVSYPGAFINFAWALIAMYGMYTDQFKKGRPENQD